MLVLISAALLGQSVEGPVFEAASLKKLSPPYVFLSLTGGPGTATPTRATMRFGAGALLPEAFNLPMARFVNMDKISADQYELIATVKEGATKDEFRAMLRNLLVERFHLRYHRETREVKRYELHLADGGPKLKDSTKDPQLPAADGPIKFTRTADGYLDFPKGVNTPFYGNGPRFSLQRVQTTMAEFAQQLDAEWLHDTVSDQTGLVGKYDFTLRFSATPNAEGEFSEPDLQTAMRQQLGILLREVKAPGEVIVIDSIDREATPN